MEMRSTRRGERYYLPWDPLQLDDRNDSGLRVQKNSILLMPYKSYKNKIYWTPLFHNNMAHYYGEPEELHKFLSLCGEQIQRYSQGSITFEMFSFRGELEEVLLAADDEYSPLRYHPYENTLQHWVDQVLRHRALMNAYLVQESLVEAPNKRCQVLMLCLGEPERRQLMQNASLRSKLIDVAKNSYRERLYLLLVAAEVFPLPEDLVGAFDTSFFLGETNARACATRYYRDIPLGPQSVVMECCGAFYQEGREKLLPLSPGRFTPTEWFLQREAAHAEEERLYREYLASLDDGLERNNHE